MERKLTPTTKSATTSHRGNCSSRFFTLRNPRTLFYITLLIVADGNCLVCSFTVARVVQMSLDANTMVSTCRWAETPVDDSVLIRKLVTTGSQGNGL